MRTQANNTVCNASSYTTTDEEPRHVVHQRESRKPQFQECHNSRKSRHVLHQRQPFTESNTSCTWAWLTYTIREYNSNCDHYSIGIKSNSKMDFRRYCFDCCAASWDSTDGQFETEFLRLGAQLGTPKPRESKGRRRIQEMICTIISLFHIVTVLQDMRILQQIP